MSDLAFIVMLLLAIFLLVMAVHWTTSFAKGGMQRWIRSAETQADAEEKSEEVKR